MSINNPSAAFIKWFADLAITAGAFRHFPREAGLNARLRTILSALDTRDMENLRQRGRKIGLCGQAPSVYPEFAQFLVEQGIDSISQNPDTVLETTLAILEKEGSLAPHR